MKKEYSKIILIFVIAIFLEVIVFNITSFRTLLGNFEVKTYESPEYMYEDDGKVYLKIKDVNEEVVTFKLELKDIEDITEYRIFYSDETSKEFKDLASKQYIQDFEKSKYIPLYLSGETRELILLIDKNIYESNCLEKIVLNEKIPFDFNLIRFLIVLGILSFAYCMKNLKIFNENYSSKSIKQEMILIGVLAVFLVLLSFINTYSCSEQSSNEESFLNFETTEGMYNKDFVDAIKDGKLYLPFEPTETFLSLENPYDDLVRGSLTIRDYDYKWDTAYFNGHFYVYFGILPLLLVFLPYNLLTGGYLKVSVVVFGFSVLVFILLKEILLKIIARYFSNIPFRNVVYFLITLLSGSVILYANGMSRFYELVIVAGIYFVLQGIYFILKSMENEKYKHLNIFLGALFLSLSVACRPTDLFVSCLILPYLISIFVKYVKTFKENKESKINLLKLIVAVAVPYIAVGIALMIYNYQRFGNVFEFGNKYQLTIVNMGALGSRLFAIPTGIICNLFGIPKFTTVFPFIGHANDLTTFYGYYYIENMIGGLFMIAPICFATFYIFKFNKKETNKELKIIVNGLVTVGIFIAVLSIAMAGSNQRYLIDYAWMIVLAGILIFASVYCFLKSDEAKKILQVILCVTAIYTFLLSILAGILSEKEQMKNYSKEEYYKTRYTVSFWE